jgi:NADPH-dependent glutamate synthase beta subunit-like oxidoreductase
VHHELTVWSRGIIMDKEARDVSTCIATAARKLGYYAENVSDYVDDPDRTNCLVRRYARFADQPILDRFVYENPHPDWVVLIEETIIKAVNFFRGTLDGQGVLVINSARDPAYLLKFLPEHMLAKLGKLVVVDATGLAEQRGSSPWMFVRDLSELAFDRMSTEGAVERLAIGMGIAAPVIGALVAATGELDLDTVAEVVADRDAMLRGARQHTVIQYAAVLRGGPMSVRGTHVPEHLRLPIAGVTPPPTEKEGQRLFPTGNFRFFRPVYKDKTPPCNHACPTGEQIQKYLDYVKHDRYLDGYLTICEDNPVPAITGRVCYHPCETACNRAAHDEPIGIRGVERFLGDFGLNLPDNPVKKSLPPLNGKTVAIVGAGPGGLGCAYHLRRRGYASVIFDALDKPGGMLRAGIPAWHLPETILDAEIAKLLDLGGIEIRCGVRIGAPDGELTLEDLTQRYDAVFLALGQDVGRRHSAEGAQARGVIGALEFLRETGLGRPVTIGRNVLVIGGGNTASDAARSAIRLGGGEATIVSLEAENELLIVAEDLEQARDEGVRFRPNTTLIRVITEDGQVTGAVLGQARLSRDVNGTVTPQLSEGTEVEVPCDTILVAIGQVQVLDWLPAEAAERGLIRTDEYGRIPHDSGRIFAGGDVTRGPAMVVDALGDGKRAARDIDRVLRAEPLAPEDPVEVMPYEKLNTAYFRHAPRTEAPLAPAESRRRSQVTEVTLAYSREQALAEADRCMSCGVCNGCDNCYIVCPDISVMRDARENGHYSIRTHYCKGCLVCVQECPTGCLEKVPEMDFDEPDAVVRMETAFAPYDGAHAEQAPFTRQLIEDAIAEYDASKSKSNSIHPNGQGVTP